MKLTSFSNFVNCFILYCFLMIAVFFISCEQRSNEQLFYDEDGRLSVKVIGEDMANACYWVYYNNGETKGKYCLIDSIRQGIEYGYYENGNLKSKIYLVDGKTNGEGFFYHENGKMSPSDADRDFAKRPHYSHPMFYGCCLCRKFLQIFWTIPATDKELPIFSIIKAVL